MSKITKLMERKITELTHNEYIRATIYKYSLRECFDDDFEEGNELILNIPYSYPFMPEIQGKKAHAVYIRDLYVNFAELMIKVIGDADKDEYDETSKINTTEVFDIDKLLSQLKEFKYKKDWTIYKFVKQQLVYELIHNHGYCEVQIPSTYLGVPYFKGVTDEYTEFVVPEDTTSKFFSMLKGKRISYFQLRKSNNGAVSEGMIKVLD